MLENKNINKILINGILYLYRGSGLDTPHSMFALSLFSRNILFTFFFFLSELYIDSYCLQGLFDPINPDKDTAETRQWTRRERLDNEFWLLQKLQDIMERARFRELEKSEVHQMLAEHGSNEGVRVRS